MSNFANQEFQRILSNPENEIISDSLKDRLKTTTNSMDFSIRFEEVQHECSLESLSMFPVSRKISRLSLAISGDVLRSLFDSKFEITSSDLGISINSETVESIDCFKFNSDTYILELSLNEEELLDD